MVSAGVVSRIPHSKRTLSLRASNLDMDSGGVMIVIPAEVTQRWRLSNDLGNWRSRIASKSLD